MSGFRPRHLSVSSVGLYVKCPAQFRQRYVDRLVEPTTVPQAWGIAFHKTLEALHRGENADRAWISTFNAMRDTLAASGQELTPDKIVGLELIDAYRERGLDVIPAEPERKFVLPFPSSKIPVPLLGFIDLALPSHREFRDFKTTGGTYWNAAKVALEPQVHVYGWAYQKLYHHRADRAVWCVFNTQTVTLETYEALPSPDMFRVFEQQAEAVWDGIVNERYDGCGRCTLCAPRVVRENGPTVEWDA